MLFLFFLINLFTQKPEKLIAIKNVSAEKIEGWKNYQNLEYNFSFLYPDVIISDFKFNEHEKILRRVIEIAKDPKNTDYSVFFEINAWKYNGNIEDFLKNGNVPEVKNYKSQKIVSNILRGIRVTNINGDNRQEIYFYYNFFRNKNFIYNFALVSDEKILIKANTDLLDEIISTIKFN